MRQPGKALSLIVFPTAFQDIGREREGDKEPLQIKDFRNLSKKYKSPALVASRPANRAVMSLLLLSHIA